MHERISVSSICFMQSTLSQQAAYWQALAAKRISLLGPHISSEGLSTARAVLSAGDYRLETVVHPFLPGQNLDPEPESWEVPRANLRDQIEAVSQLGGRSIYMTTGGHGGMTWERAAETFAAAIEPCAALARAKGIALMIENAPPQYADIHIAHSLRDTLTLAELAGIGVCIDLFGCWTEAGLQSLIERAVARSDLIQVSDNVAGDRALPARAVPGDGDMPLQRLLDWCLAAGYQGAFDLELLGPRIDAEGALEATRRAADRTTELLNALGV